MPKLLAVCVCHACTRPLFHSNTIYRTLCNKSQTQGIRTDLYRKQICCSALVTHCMVTGSMKAAWWSCEQYKPFSFLRLLTIEANSKHSRPGMHLYHSLPRLFSLCEGRDLTFGHCSMCLQTILKCKHRRWHNHCKPFQTGPPGNTTQMSCKMSTSRPYCLHTLQKWLDVTAQLTPA